MIIDIGYKQTSLVLLCFENKKCKILMNQNNYDINGELIDNKLMDLVYNRMRKDFPNLDSDIRKDKKLYLKIQKAVIIAKEKLSAIGTSTVTISVDNVENDYDYEGVIDIKEINEIVQKYVLPTLENEIKLLLQNQHLFVNTSDENPLDIVIVGGTCKIQRIKQYLSNMQFTSLIFSAHFGDKVTETMNIDTNISTGCCHYKLLKLGLWKYNIEYEKEKVYEFERGDIIPFTAYTINTVNFSPHFVEIDPQLEGINICDYYSKLLLNHKFLIDKQNVNISKLKQQNGFQTIVYIYIIIYFYINN